MLHAHYLGIAKQCEQKSGFSGDNALADAKQWLWDEAQKRGFQ
jgi:hypothetical protein